MKVSGPLNLAGAEVLSSLPVTDLFPGRMVYVGGQFYFYKAVGLGSNWAALSLPDTVTPDDVGKVLRSDGLNGVFWDEQYPDMAAHLNHVLRSDGLDTVFWDPQYPDMSGHLNHVLRSDGVDNVVWSSQYPDMATHANDVLHSNGIDDVYWMPQYPDMSGHTGDILHSNGANAVYWTPQYPTMLGNTGKFLATDGSIVLWSNIPGLLPAQPGNAGKYLRTDGTDANWEFVLRSDLSIGTPDWVLINDPTGLMSEEQYLDPLRGGLGLDASGFTGLVRAAAGVFSATPLIVTDLPSGIPASKIAGGLVTDIEFNRLVSQGRVMSTGKVQGAVVSLNADPSKFDISLGRGAIIDFLSNPVTPTATEINPIGPFTAVALTNILTSDLTYILINLAGGVVQQTTFPTPDQQRDNIFLARINHANHTAISFIDNIGNTAQSVGNQYADLLDAMGPFNIKGNSPAAIPATMTVSKSFGTMFSRYFNYVVNPKNPHNVPIPLANPMTFRYATFGTTVGGDTTTILPKTYDPDGLGQAVVPTVPSSTATIQRIFMFPSGNIRIQLGQKVYTNLAAALSGLSTEQFKINPTIDGFAILIGYIAIQQNTTDVGDTDRAMVLTAGRFETGSAAGFGGSTTFQQTYSNSTRPQIGLTALGGGLQIQDNSTPITGDLFSIENSTGLSKFLQIDTQGIKGTGIVAGFALISDGFGAIKSHPSTVSSELSALNGITGNIQSQLGLKADKSGSLAQFAPTSSAQLAALLSDETGFAAGGLAVFSKSPTIESPIMTSLAAAPANVAGKIWYDSTDNVLRYFNDSTDAVAVGQEINVRVRNGTGATLLNGQVVRIVGNVGAIPLVDKARADSVLTSNVFAVLTQDITNNTNGYATILGRVKTFDTSSYAVGDFLYLSTTVAGGLTNVRPAAPNFAMPIGTVLVSGSAATGIFIVDFGRFIRIGLGAANQLRGVDVNATQEEYKTIFSGPANLCGNPNRYSPLSGATSASLGWFISNGTATTVTTGLPRDSWGSAIKYDTTTAGQYLRYRFKADGTDISRRLQVLFSHIATFGDYQLQVFSGTDAALSSPLQIICQSIYTDASGVTQIPTGTQDFIANFDTTTRQFYEVRWTALLTAAKTITINGVNIGAGISGTGSINSKFQAYGTAAAGWNWTAGTGGSALQYAYWRQNGPMMKVRAGFQVGTAGSILSGNLIWTLPNGLHIDANFADLRTSNNDDFGTIHVVDAGVGHSPTGVCVTAGNSTQVIFLIGSTQLSSTGPFTFAAGDGFWIDVEIPIQEWSDAGQTNVLNPIAQSPIRAGTIQAFAGATTPAGWLDCDGTAYLRTQYPQLFAQLQTTWDGTGNVATGAVNPLTGTAYTSPGATMFRVPDLRGSFLRGVGTFTDSIGTDTTLAGYQADQGQGHIHNYNVVTAPGNVGGPYTWDISGTQRRDNTTNTTGGLGGGTNNTTSSNPTLASGAGIGSPTSDSANGTPRVGKEVRPRNVGVRYIIKVWDESFNTAGLSTLLSGNAVSTNLCTSPVTATGWFSSAATAAATTTIAAELPLAGPINTAIKISRTTVGSYDEWRWVMPVGMMYNVIPILWHQLIETGYVTGEFKVDVYVYTDATYTDGTKVRKTLRSDVSAITNIPAANGAFGVGNIVSFDALAEVYYGMRITRLSNTHYLSITNVKIGQADIGVAPANGNWQNYSPTIGNTTSTASGRYRIDGPNIEVQVYYTLTSAIISGTQLIPIPSGYTINTSALADSTANMQAVGVFRAVKASGSPFNSAGTVMYATATQVSMQAAGNGTVIDADDPWAPAIGDKYSLFFTVPINELAGNNPMLVGPGNFQEYYSHDGTSQSNTWALVPNLAGATGNQFYLITPASPTQDGDVFDLELRDPTGATVNQNSYPYIAGTSSFTFGWTIAKQSNGLFQIILGKGGLTPNLGLGAASSDTWASLRAAGYMYRVRKTKAGIPAGLPFGLLDGSAQLYKAGLNAGYTGGAAIAAGYVGQEIVVDTSTTTVTTGSGFTLIDHTMAVGTWLVTGAVGIVDSSTAGVNAVACNLGANPLSIGGASHLLTTPQANAQIYQVCQPQVLPSNGTTHVLLSAFVGGTWQNGTDTLFGRLRLVRIA